MCDLGKEVFSELKVLEISCKAFDKNIVVKHAKINIFKEKKKRDTLNRIIMQTFVFS